MQFDKSLIEENINANFPQVAKDSLHSFHYKHEHRNLTPVHAKDIRIILMNRINRYMLEEIDNTTAKFYIAGGSVLSMLLYFNQFKINDIDIFPQSDADYSKLKTILDAGAKKESVVPYENHNSRKYDFGDIKIDLIKIIHKSIDDMFNIFDLNVVRVGFDERGDFRIKGSLTDVFSFDLEIAVPITTDNAFNLLKRVMKYAGKGFMINNTQMSKLYATIRSNENEYKPGSISMKNSEWVKAHKYAVEETQKSYHKMETEPEVDMPANTVKTPHIESLWDEVDDTMSKQYSTRRSTFIGSIS